LMWLLTVSSKITKLRSAPVLHSHLKQVWGYLNRGLDFTVNKLHGFRFG